MTDFRRRNRTFLFKTESAPGTDATPTTAADAIKCENPTFTDNWEVDETDEVTGSLDQSPRYTGGGSSAFNIPCLLKGAGTGGEAPEIGPLLKAAGFSETLVASDVSDVLQAGSTTTTLVLASGEITTDNEYRGAVIRITDGDQSGYVGVITASVASTDTVTVMPAVGGSAADGDGYTIDACAIYRPVSSGLVTGTGYLYEHNSGSGDDILRKVIGAVCGAQFTFPVRRKPRVTFDLQGQLVAPTDVSAPSAAAYAATVAPVLVGATTILGTTPIKYSELSFSAGNEVTLADDPSATYGYDVAGIVSRRGTGRINPRRVNVATANVFSRISAGTELPLWNYMGSGAGRRISTYSPALRFVNGGDDENRGFAHDGLDFDFNGSDDGLFLTFL